MGRTNPTFRDLLRGVRNRWKSFRRALRRDDQPYFDRLFDQADSHADAAGYMNADDPLDPIVLSVLLEHEKRLADLESSGPPSNTDDTASEAESRDAV